MPITKPHSWSDGEIITADLLNPNENALYTALDAGLTTSNLSASAGITPGQLAQPYEHIDVTFKFGTGGQTWALNNADYVAFPGVTTSWYYNGGSWMCTDTGNGAGQFIVEIGRWTGVATWTPKATIVAATAMTNQSATAESANQGSLGTPTEVVLDGANQQQLRCRCSVEGVGVLSAAQSQLSVTIRLQRYAQASGMV